MYDINYKTISRKVYAIQYNIWYALSMILLAFISIGLLLYEIFHPGATPRTIILLQEIDLVIAWIFLADFALGFVFSNAFGGKKRYFRDNWLNLASSIPVSAEAVRAFRLLRILRAIRIIRAGLNLYFFEKRVVKSNTN